MPINSVGPKIPQHTLSEAMSSQALAPVEGNSGKASARPGLQTRVTAGAPLVGTGAPKIASATMASLLDLQSERARPTADNEQGETETAPPQNARRFHSHQEEIDTLMGLYSN